MTTGDEPANGIERLSARAAIQDCLYRYCHAVDRRRWRLMESVFHEGAMAQVSVLPRSPWREFVEQGAALLEFVGTTHHQLGNIKIAFDDADGADVEAYISAFHHIPADAPPGGPFGGTGAAYDVLLSGRYIDRFENRNGEWRIIEHGSVSDVRQHRTPDRDTPTPQQAAVADNSSIHAVERWLV